MMSKISFSKLLKEDMKRRSWLIALVSVLLFIAQPVIILFLVEGLMDSANEGLMTLAEVKTDYMDLIGFEENYLVAILLILFAVLIGISGYAYLHSRVQLDFYHSLPVKRQKWFLVQLVSGLLIFAVPYFLSTVLSLLVGVANGIMEAGIFAAAMECFIINILGFMVIYLTSILAMIMTGKILIGIMGFCTFLAYGPGVVFVLNNLIGRFFTTAIGEQVYGMAYSLSSPILLWMKVREKWQVYDKETVSAWIYLGILILLVIVLFGLCMWLNTKRNTEAAEQSMAFSKTESVIKIMLVIPLSLAIGLLLSTMAHRNFEVWFFIGILLGAVLINAIIEFIYHLDIRELFVRKLQLVLAMLITVVIGCIFQFDFIGYDSYLPAMEDVEQMALYSYGVNGSFVYRVTEDDGITRVEYGERAALDEMVISDFEPIYEIARNGVKNVRKETEGMDLVPVSVKTEGMDLVTVSVKYVLKNGKSVYRSYQIDRNVFTESEQALFTQEEYKQKIYPIFNKESANIQSMFLMSLKGEVQLELTADQKANLLETYKTELRESTFDDFYYQNMSARLNLEYMRGTQASSWYSEYGYPISKNFTKTLSLLNEYGYQTETEIKAETVSKITIYNYNTSQTSFYSSEIEIKEILADFYAGSIDMDYGNIGGLNYDLGVEIIMKDGKVVWGNFKNEAIPDCVSSQSGYS